MENLNLTGTRVIVSLPEPSRAAAAAKYYLDNKAHLTATNAALPKDFYTESFWEKRLKQALAEFEADLTARLFIANHSDPNTFIGSLNFTQIFRGPFQACYLGYSIDHRYEGKGLMREALELGIGFMFDSRNLHRVMANYLPENKRSASLLARLGFRVDGSSPDYLFINGVWREHVMTSLTNSTWLPREQDAGLFS